VPGAGLNLTRATLDATLKYPWRGAVPAEPAGGQVRRLRRRRRRVRLDPGRRAGRQACLEAQVMDWADDVAYSVHDLEDGLHAGLITLAQLRDRPSSRRSRS
jgi:dGTPase